MFGYLLRVWRGPTPNDLPSAVVVEFRPKPRDTPGGVCTNAPWPPGGYVLHADSVYSYGVSWPIERQECSSAAWRIDPQTTSLRAANLLTDQTQTIADQAQQ